MVSLIVYEVKLIWLEHEYKRIDGDPQRFGPISLTVTEFGNCGYWEYLFIGKATQLC